MDKQELLDKINDRCEYNKHNHIYATDIGPDYAVVEAELRPEALNPRGIAHGGFVYSLCDVAAGILINHGTSKSVTLSGNLYFLRQSKGESLRCEARLIKPGRTVNVVETGVYDDRGELTAKGVFEIYILEPIAES